MKRLVLAGVLLLAACETYNGPVNVMNLGRGGDSAGAIIVGARDNVYDIAKRYRLPLRDIIDINGLQPPYRLSQGQRLKMPAPMDYRVRERDTLQSVANMFSVSASELVSTNRLFAPYRLTPGQVLRLPRPEAQETEPAVAKMPVPSVAAEALPARRPPVATAPLTPPGNYSWPVRGNVIAAYGPQGDGLYNDGINIAAARGAPVTAAADGVVVYIGNDLKSYGNLVLIRHGGGMITAYAHMNAVSVTRGAGVRRGQTIGTVGSSGTVATPQLHFEIRRGSKTLDPRQYL